MPVQFRRRRVLIISIASLLVIIYLIIKQSKNSISHEDGSSDREEQKPAKRVVDQVIDESKTTTITSHIPPQRIREKIVGIDGKKVRKIDSHVYEAITRENARTDYSAGIILPLLIDHLYPNNYSTLYGNYVLLSCSSDSYNSAYCYYLPYTALAWRRIGFEPIIFLAGSDQKFKKMPLINLLKNNLQIRYYFINVDSSRSISTSQIIRLFGGFISYEYNTKKDIFILIADADLLPISRYDFEINSNHTNYILAVNAYCCPSEKLSYENYHNIHYYPVSYVGMRKDLWKKIFLPLNNCSMSSNLTIDMIDCCLKEKMNITVPKNVIKSTSDWDIDQKFLSLLIAQAEHLYGTYVDKRKLGRRLDPDQNFLSSEFDSILLYDDIHLPNKHEDIILSNHTWNILSKAFSNLFHNETIQVLSRYHYQTAADVLGYNKTTTEFVTSYYSKDLNNNGTFYTDSSGRSLMKRRRDQRDGYRFSQSEKSAGNYYPLVTGIIIKDEKQDLQLGIVTDRAQGGGSIEDGQVEIMLHRRILTDDGLGVSETLNEGGIDGTGLVVRGRHLLAFGKSNDNIKFYREYALKSVWKPIIAFRNDHNDEPLDYKTWSLLKAGLPPQINILTIEPISHEKNILTILFRIEHIYDRNEHSTLSKSVKIKINKIFNDHKLLEAKEVTLGANMYKTASFNRLKWTLDSADEIQKGQDETSVFDGQTIDLYPMQIRSFIIKLSQS